MNKYLKHITNLCRRHRIILYTGIPYYLYMATSYDDSKDIIVDNNPTPTFCLVSARAIFIPIINNKRTYFEALHEVGHIVMQGPNEECQLYAASRLKKVTKSMLKSEQKASTFALKANKFATFAYMDRLAAWNQYGYIQQYESDWKTKLKNRTKYMTFSPRGKN